MRVTDIVIYYNKYVLTFTRLGNEKVNNNLGCVIFSKEAIGNKKFRLLA